MKNLILLLIFLIFSNALSEQEDSLFINEFKPFLMPVDLSLTPKIGIGHALAGNRPLIRNLSINLFVGRGSVLQGIEIGGLANVELNNSAGIQLAGLSNINRDELVGIQTSGIANACGSTFFGIQTAGLANLTACGGGIQIAGLLNFSGSYLYRINRLMTTSTGEETALSPENKIIWDRGFTGFQISGLLNILDGELNGLQLGGLINYARIVKNGFQIAPFNISEDNSGYFLGLVNFIGKRKLSYDLWGEESGFINAGVRSGTDRFHNVSFVGVQTKSNPAYTYGLLFGWRLFTGSSFYFDADLSSQNIQTKFGKWNNYLNILNKFRLLAGYRFSHHLSIFGGPVINAFISSETDGSNLVGYSLYQTNSACDCGNIIRQKYWLGLNFGLSISN